MSAAVRALLYSWAVVGVGLIVWAQIRLRADHGYLLDLYPLYRGAQALLSSGDAYDLQHLQQADLGVSLVGNAYPLHAVLLLGMPLALMPAGAAVVVWTLAVGGAWIAAVAWAGESPYWFLWLPMWQALLIQQPSAALGVAAIVALGAVRRGNPWILALCLVLLAAKPQQFLVLCVALAWWGRAWWRQMAITWGSVTIACFVVQPDWIPRWLERVDIRADIVPVSWLGWLVVPVAVVLAIRGWRESSIAVAASGLGPWPAVAGYYTAVAWPLGAARNQAAAFALLGILGTATAELTGSASSSFVIVAGVGVALVAACSSRGAAATVERGKVAGPG